MQVGLHPVWRAACLANPLVQPIVACDRFAS
jgi:hypothetical protein